MLSKTAALEKKNFFLTNVFLYCFSFVADVQARSQGVSEELRCLGLLNALEKEQEVPDNLVRLLGEPCIKLAEGIKAYISKVNMVFSERLCGLLLFLNLNLWESKALIIVRFYHSFRLISHHMCKMYKKWKYYKINVNWNRWEILKNSHLLIISDAKCFRNKATSMSNQATQCKSECYENCSRAVRMSDVRKWEIVQ